MRSRPYRALWPMEDPRVRSPEGKPNLSGVRRVLVMRHRAAGDLLLTTPAFRALRAGLPSASIDVLVSRGTGELLKGNPDVDRVLEIGLGCIVGLAVSLLILPGRAARLYATHRPSMSVHGLGVTEHTQGTDGVRALVNLALLTGNYEEVARLNLARVVPDPLPFTAKPTLRLGRAQEPGKGIRAQSGEVDHKLRGAHRSAQACPARTGAPAGGSCSTT
jgi:hypothetical protein